MEVKKIFVGSIENSTEEVETEKVEEKMVEGSAEEVETEKVEEKANSDYSNMPRTGNTFLNGFFKSYSKRKSEQEEEIIAGEAKKEVSGEELQVNDVLEDYEYLKEKGAAFECTFDIRRADGSYMTINGDVTIIMKKPNTKSYVSREDYVIGRSLRVIVVDVDINNRVVTVENVSDRQIDATRIRLRDSIDKSLSRGQKVLVSGKVVSIHDRVVIVNIFEKGIEGVCSIEFWRKGYVRNLAAECSVGEIYDFYIVSESNYKNTKRYILDRRELVEDEWDVLAKNKMMLDVLENKGTITIRCVEIPEGKTYWWGVCESIKGIEIMCDYTRGAGKIEFGESYKCKVEKFDLKKRFLRCSPYAKASQGSSSSNALAVAKRIRERMKDNQ